MNLVQRDEVLALGAYEEIRSRFRARIIELKRSRRVLLGSHMSLLFENHDTALYQIQEMLRTERITREAAIEHEIETYNDLVPKSGELSATAMIEYPDTTERDRMLVALRGVESRFYLRLGVTRAWSESELRTVDDAKTTAVHYLRFPLGELLEPLRARTHGLVVGVDHEAYRAETELAPAVIESLAQDLED